MDELQEWRRTRYGWDGARAPPFPRDQDMIDYIWRRRMVRYSEKLWERRKANFGNALYVLAWTWGAIAVVAITAALLRAAIWLIAG